MFVFLTLGFGFCGSHESCQMSLGDVQLKTDTDGVEYQEFREKLTKTRQESESRSFAQKNIW